MNIYICDDDINQMKYTYQFITSYMEDYHSAFPVIYRQIAPEALIEELEESRFTADIIILDIQMDEIGELNGISMAQRINDRQTDCQIIFFSGFIDYAPLVYEATHLYFVLKPQMKEMLPKALEKALSQLSRPPETISLCIANHMMELSTNKIMYIEKNGHHSIIYTNNNRLTVSMSLKELESMLTVSFLRCHGGYIVNLEHVYSFTSISFLLKNKTAIPVGRTFLQTSKKAYLNYISANL